MFRDWQRTQTQSSVKAKGPETANRCLVLRRQEPPPRGTRASCRFWQIRFCALLRSARQGTVFSIDKDLHRGRQTIERRTALLPDVIIGTCELPVRRFGRYTFRLVAQVTERQVIRENWRGYCCGRSSSTTSERSRTRSRMTSRPSGEMSKSRILKSGATFVNCRSAPVDNSRVHRFLC